MGLQQYSVPVLVVGAGPAGLIAALQLAKNGISCMLVERNLSTTKWPKMDITNCRTMELLKRLGIDDGLRAVGVPQHYSFDVNFSTGLSDKGQLIAKWDLASPDAWRIRIREHNDGSMPREPYQRCSQAIFEAWLKPKIQENNLIETHFGWKFESLIESVDGVESTILDDKNQLRTIRSQYVLGCDGAGSRVRAAIGSRLEGGPAPAALHLTHFKSRDLAKLQKQGQFWHIFFTSGSVVIAQDEIDTWTVHTPVPVGTDVTAIDPEQAVYKALGGENSPLEIKIDQILVTSAYRPSIYLADKYESPHSRVFISGDAAHQNIATGGYGMNTAVGDSFDIGWKIAAVLAGHGGKELLRSYETERRPVAARNIERSGVHFSVHTSYWGWCAESPGLVSADTEDGQSLRKRIAEHVMAHDGENKDHGIELGYRYDGSPIIAGEDHQKEPVWDFREYVPSTWPGARAPQVFLADNETSIYDLFGSGSQFTLVDFTEHGAYVQVFEEAAKISKVPLKYVHLPNEAHVRTIWERDAVLVRPDDHVAWRSPEGTQELTKLQAEAVLFIATGHRIEKNLKFGSENIHGISDYQAASGPADSRFTAIAEVQNYEDVQNLGAFQK